MVRHTILPENASMPVREVTASRGKIVRAEPIAALYARGEVDHVLRYGELAPANFADLEDQRVNMTTAGYMGERSPDRADAAVWALTELSQGKTVQIIGVF